MTSGFELMTLDLIQESFKLKWVENQDSSNHSLQAGRLTAMAELEQGMSSL